MLDPHIMMLVALVFVAAGTIKGLVGIGLPTASVGRMAQFIDPKLAVSLVVVPIVLVNGWQAYRQGQFLTAVWQFRWLAVAMVPVLFATTFITSTIDSNALVLWLGLVVVLFAATSLFFQPPALPARLDVPAQGVAGVAAGVLGGVTSIWAPPVIIYLLSRRVEKEDFVRASGAILFCGSIPFCPLNLCP